MAKFEYLMSLNFIKFSRLNVILNSNFAAHRWRYKHGFFRYTDCLPDRCLTMNCSKNCMETKTLTRGRITRSPRIGEGMGLKAIPPSNHLPALIASCHFLERRVSFAEHRNKRYGCCCMPFPSCILWHLCCLYKMIS